MPDNFDETDSFEAPGTFDVPGTVDERLAAGAARLEQEAAVRPPAGVRARGDQRRRRHTATMAVAPVLVLAIAGAAGLTLRPSGGSSRYDAGGPPPTSSVRTSAGSTTPSTNAAAAVLAGTVDLAHRTLTVHDAQGRLVKTLPITAGVPAHPTRTGTFTVVFKEPSKKITAPIAGYTMTVNSFIDLGPNAPAIYAMPWWPEIGTKDSTHGDIGLTPADAVWLYNHLSVGNTIQVEGDPAH